MHYYHKHCNKARKTLQVFSSSRDKNENQQGIEFATSQRRVNVLSCWVEVLLNAWSSVFEKFPSSVVLLVVKGSLHRMTFFVWMPSFWEITIFYYWLTEFIAVKSLSSADNFCSVCWQSFTRSHRVLQTQVGLMLKCNYLQTGDLVRFCSLVRLFFSLQRAVNRIPAICNLQCTVYLFTDASAKYNLTTVAAVQRAITAEGKHDKWIYHVRTWSCF